ncbi:2-oxo acid dehydrogenase subunit E2 [Puia sp. P3]|uniref:2-oxo acid dehydrogenase subunit E2 n=1 Tax=Puia sp. P3 TaxID=3423952 RepID=UPI003D664A4E
MSNLRKTVSRRLVEAKNTTAMLTTFNEVDMSAVMALRAKYKDKFKEKHGVNLGFMSFFHKGHLLRAPGMAGGQRLHRRRRTRLPRLLRYIHCR